MKCFDCPRRCGVDRSQNAGFCGESDKIRVAKIIENFMWEEPCISGSKGALAIFFAGCNLRCSFCQNYKISHNGFGKEYTVQEFRDLMLSYDLSTFSSIDLVTPTHFSSLLLDVFDGLKLPLPIVWNSSGYENEDMIERLSGFVDVFLPDFKYYSSDLSKGLSCAEDYFQVASKAICIMKKAKPQNIFHNGVMQSGLLIRHLVLPGQQLDSFKVLDFIKENIDDPFISLMSQFTPNGNGNLQRKILPLEYKAVVAHAQKLGLTDGYIQEGASASDQFVPKF